MKLGRTLMALLCMQVLNPILAPDSHAAEPKIVMLLWRGITEPEEAYLDRLQTLGINAKLVQLDAQQDRNAVVTHLKSMEDDIASGKIDIVYSFGTTVTRTATQFIKDRVPIVFNVVFDPVSGQLVKSMDQPGTNVTGVINGVPIPDQLDAFSRLGKLKSLVVLFNPKEPNSNLIADQIVDWGRNHGVEVIRRRAAATGNSLEEVMEEIRSGRLKADALYSGADSYIASKAADIQAAIGDRIRLFGGTQTFILRGWLAAYSPPVEDMGRAAADLTADILKGADPRTTPVVLPQPRLMISRAAAAAHGIAPPDDALLEK